MHTNTLTAMLRNLNEREVILTVSRPIAPYVRKGSAVNEVINDVLSGTG